MTSAIDQTKPTAGTATTSSVRANFTAAYDEINALQRGSYDYVTTSGTNSYTATFTNAPGSLTDGLRISVEVGTSNTGAATLNVNGLGAVSIVKQDGTTALASGDLVAGQIIDLMYNGSNWVWLNSNSTIVDVVLGLVYPIDHIITTVKTGNPGDAGYFYSGVSFGTWAAFGAGQTLVGLDSGDADFDTLEETGGSKTHTLTDEEIPDHNHHIASPAVLTTGSSSLTSSNQMAQTISGVVTLRGDGNAADRGLSGAIVDSSGNAVSAGGAHTIVQPYITTYFWKRTA